MNLNSKKKGFTLVEIIIVSVIFTTIMIGIILAINRTYLFVDNTRMAVRATNYAREGMELMYNLRDTNWRRHSGERDKYWFNTGLLSGDKLIEGKNFGKGVYALKEKKLGGNSYIYAQKLSGCSDDELYSDSFWECSVAKSDAEMHFDGEYPYYDYNDKVMKTGNLQNLLLPDGVKFYRIVRVYGIYCKDKDGDSTNPNQVVDSTYCNKDGDPKEMRFCVKIFYEVMGGRHSTELCSIMTNFME